MSLPDEAQLLDDIGHAPDGAMNLRQLASLYGLARAGRLRLAKLLRKLAKAGKLEKLRGQQRYGLPQDRPALRAVFSGTKRGFGFAAPDDPDHPDILIPERHQHGCMHGDTVEVSLLEGTDPARPAGEVVAIVERGRTRLVGLFERSSGRRAPLHRVLPFDPRVARELFVPDRFTHDAEDGDFVEVALLRESRGLQESNESLSCRVTGVLGQIGEKGTDARVVVASYGLVEAHGGEALAEAERQATSLPADRDCSDREDLRSLTTVTIDGDEARDFDDAVSVARTKTGFRLHVHVADVAEYVTEGSALDSEAYDRATSVYFPDRAIHMLPDCLSAGSCSLRPNEDRLAMTAILDYDRNGKIVATSFCESLICSDRRMTYTEIRRLLVDEDEALRKEHADLLPDFELMSELAGLLMERRARRGGLDFDLPVPVIKIAEDGLVVDVVASERNIAHRIVEEFMIAANEAVALHLNEAEEPCVYRNHEAPSSSRAEALAAAAAVFGHELALDEGVPSAGDIGDMLKSAAGRPEEQLLTIMALRTMMQARYEADLSGHFGLALEGYAHFTSPIRRYPDLIVHRALKRLLRGEATPVEDRIEALAALAEDAEHCSARERNAEEAERALTQWKACAFAETLMGSLMQARITGFFEAGVYVRLETHPIDAQVHFRDLDDDYYVKDDTGFSIRGQRTRRTLRPGDRLHVRIVSVDMLRRLVHLEEA